MSEQADVCIHPLAAAIIATVQYLEIPRDADERTTLTAFLDWQRETLARKCEGVDEAGLKRQAAPPSNLTLLGLVRHMAEVERGWFRRTVAGEEVPDIYSPDGEGDLDFTDLDSVPVDVAFDNWHEECRRSRDIAAAHELDDVGIQRTGRRVSLRWVLIHMVEEYSRHNGHADLLRESVDGATGYD